MRSSAEVKQQHDYWLKDLHNSMVELLMFFNVGLNYGAASGYGNTF